VKRKEPPKDLELLAGWTALQICFDALKTACCEFAQLPDKRAAESLHSIRDTMRKAADKISERYNGPNFNRRLG